MYIVPVTHRTANDFVALHHRHSRPTVGHKFSVGVEDDGRLVGVAIAGRPVARHMDDGSTLEILRVCTDGARNACSMLYGACRRAGAAMGYRRVITYTLADEDGASVRASGFIRVAEVAAQQWSRPSRQREFAFVAERVRWEYRLP